MIVALCGPGFADEQSGLAANQSQQDETNAHDKFLGQISMSGATDAFHDHVDAFSGYLHINMVDLRLPGKGGLDLVIQHYYSSNVWNRVEGPPLTLHNPGADPGDHLGGSGWQLHMGKLVQNGDGSFTAIMPDGSTHPLYAKASGPGYISRERWTLIYTTSGYELTLTDGTVYTFADAYQDYWGHFVAQCTQISKPGVTDSIHIKYDDNDPTYRKLLWIKDTYGRQVQFTYVDDPQPQPPNRYTPRIAWMILQDGSLTPPKWTFTYSTIKQLSVAILPTCVPSGCQYRDIYTLWKISPPSDANPWIFWYNDDSLSYGHGKFCLSQVQLTSGAYINYGYVQPGFDPGYPQGFNTGQSGWPGYQVQFSVIGTRTVSVGGSVIGTWSYGYASDSSTAPGTATTTVTTKDAAGSTILTEQSVFNSWGPYQNPQQPPYNDPNMWTVGLVKAHTVKTYDPSGSLMQTTEENTTYTQGNPISAVNVFDMTTSWYGAGNGRQWNCSTCTPAGGGIYAPEPNTVTRTVTREGSVSYKTVTSNFDLYGNPQTVKEYVCADQQCLSQNLKRTTDLTYWSESSLNMFVGFVNSKSAAPGAKECSVYDTYTGHVTKYVLSPAPLLDCTSDLDHNSLETDYVYDPSSGDITSETKKAIGTGTDSVTTFTYDYLDCPPSTPTTACSWGQPVQIRTVAGGGEEDILFTRQMNFAGTIRTATDGRAIPSAFTTSYSYDALNRLRAIQPPIPTSLPTTFTYTADWSTVTVTRGGHTIVYGFDGLGRLASRLDQQTNHKVTYKYNAIGVKTEQQLLYGSTPVDTYEYDALGRATSLRHNGDGSSINYVYSAAAGVGPKVLVTDEDGWQTTLAYEAFGDPGDTRLISVTDAKGKTTTYQYDNSFNLVSGITAPLPAGNRGFTYFPNLLLASETHPESGTTTYAYDGLGNLAQETRADASYERFSYDLANRLISHTFSDSTPAVTFTHDGASERKVMSSSAGNFNYTYDGDKNLVSKQTIVPGMPTFTEILTYDTMDRLETATYPSGRQVTYAYYDSDWVKAATNPALGQQSYATNIDRYVTGAIKQIDLGNGATTIYDFTDNRYRVNSIVTSSSAGSVLSLGFTYDPVSNLMTWTDNLNASNNRTFGYDPLHRLNDANAPGLWGDLTLDYDDLGNRKSKTLTQGGQTESTTYGGYEQNNRLTTVTTGTGAESYGYDARGNRTSEVLSPTVTTTAVSGITGTTATSGGNVTWDAGSSVTARGVCWATAPNPTTSNPHTSDGTGTGSFTSSLTALAPGTTYYVRAYATNSAGTGYGSGLSFTTLATVPTVTTTAVSGITSTTATSGGNVTSSGGLSVTARGVCWATAPNPTTSNPHTSDGTGTGSFTSSLTALAPGTTYYVRAYATNSAGTGYGSGLSFTTLATVPTVTTTAVSGITSTTATSGGNVTSSGGLSVTARGVCWATAPNPTTSNPHTSDGTGTGSFTSSLTALAPGTTYYVRAYATNSAGTGYGSDLNFTTLATVPTVTTTAVSGITSTTATSGGNVTSSGGLSVTARGVCWATAPNPTTSNPHTSDGTGTGSFTSSLTALAPGTTYYVRAYATNSVGTGYGSALSFTTLASDFSISASPTSVTVVQGGSGTSTITTVALNGFNASISLSASGLPSGASAGFSPTSIAAPGSGSSTLTLTAGASTATGTYTITITGSGGGKSHTATVTFTVNVAPEFSISASPTSVTVVQGGSGTSTITTVALNGFNASISLSASGLPSGASAGFSPTSIAAPGSGSSTLTLTAGASTATGTYTITITGSGGGKTRTTTVTFTVNAAPDFSISASPTSVTVVQGGSGTSTITTVALNGFNASISLSASGLPSGASVGFSPTSIPAPGSGSSTLTLTAGASTATGTYTITITGTGGGKSHTTTVTFTVNAAPDFSISLSPTTITVYRCGADAFGTVTTTISGGFNSAITLSRSGVPSGVAISFSPNPIAAPGSGSAQLNVTPFATATSGTFTVTVTGTGGGKTHSATLTLIVKPSPTCLGPVVLPTPTPTPTPTPKGGR